jgi:dihydrofolate reductase
MARGPIAPPADFQEDELRKLILRMQLSLDGYVSGPKGEIGWIFDSMDDGLTAWSVETVSQAGLHIMGSKTFNDMVSYWPTSDEPIAAPMNTIPKMVFSRTARRGAAAAGDPTKALDDATGVRAARGKQAVPSGIPGAESWTDVPVRTGDLGDEITALKQQPGRDILAHGGVGFAHSLIRTGLIDEYHLIVHPVALGAGRPLFMALDKPMRLHLLDAITFGSGAVAHIYRPG